MGLIKAAAGAIGGTLADQWKDYFYCDSMDNDVLVTRGMNRSSGRSSNTKGENVISDGSGIAVNEGQCMIIVEQGKVVEFCAEPGVFTYDSQATPSVFTGNFKESLKGAAKDAFERFKFGGGVGRDQRIYYFNTKNIVGNKYGTLNPVPFKVVIDPETGRGLGISVRCNGEYAYRITNPMLFYTNLCGNVDEDYTRDIIDSQLKSELLRELQPALAKVSKQGIDYSEIPLYTTEIAEALNEQLTATWINEKGIEIVSFGVNSVSVSDEDKAKIQALQESIILSSERLAAGSLAAAQSQAMRAAAENEAGAMTGFMGMGFAAQAGGMNAGALFQQAQQQEAAQAQAKVQEPAPQAPAAGSWTCKCGASNTGKFCVECGEKKPEAEGWTCACGAVNKGKFCPECGAKKPEGAPLYRCDKCGWTPEDPYNPPKFCPECGDIFDENDTK